MCGIVATIGYTKSDVNEMLEAIAHRGRDNRGIKEFTYKNKTIHLGHNRLSINDISPLGNQPMEYDGIELIVNGEIWNYPQLRKEYEERGYKFKSNSVSYNIPRWNPSTYQPQNSLLRHQVLSQYPN